MKRKRGTESSRERGREGQRERGIREMLQSQNSGCAFQLFIAEWSQSNVQMSLTLTPSDDLTYDLLYANGFMFMEGGMFEGS